MNLVNISPADTKGQRVSCFQCGARVALSDCKADLDGPAFKAYYCAGCQVGPQRREPMVAEAPGTAPASYYTRFGFHGAARRSA